MTKETRKFNVLEEESKLNLGEILSGILVSKEIEDFGDSFVVIKFLKKHLAEFENFVNKKQVAVVLNKIEEFISEEIKNSEQIVELYHDELWKGNFEDRYQTMLKIYDLFIKIGRNSKEQKLNLIIAYETFQDFLDREEVDVLNEFYQQLGDKNMLFPSKNSRIKLDGDFYKKVFSAPGPLRLAWADLLREMIVEKINMQKLEN